ncbi:hypothetical protein Bbelb_259880, partial [Branchiostoma belcheri]
MDRVSRFAENADTGLRRYLLPGKSVASSVTPRDDRIGQSVNSSVFAGIYFPERKVKQTTTQRKTGNRYIAA